MIHLGVKEQLAAELNEIAAQAASRDSVAFIEQGMSVIEKYQTLTQQGLLGQFYRTPFHSTAHADNAALFEVMGVVGLFIRASQDVHGDVVGVLPRGKVNEMCVMHRMTQFSHILGFAFESEKGRCLRSLRKLRKGNCRYYDHHKVGLAQSKIKSSLFQAQFKLKNQQPQPNWLS